MKLIYGGHTDNMNCIECGAVDAVDGFCDSCYEIQFASADMSSGKDYELEYRRLNSSGGA